MATQNWWDWPLPEGWEAKYDANMQRYFFIHHSSQKTQWEDPRMQLFQQQQQQQAQQWGAHQQQQQHQQHQQQQHQQQRGEQIAMQDMNTRNQQQTGGWQGDVHQKYGLAVKEVEAPSEDEEEDWLGQEISDFENELETMLIEADPEKVKQLQKKFPKASVSKIKNLLETNVNSVAACVRDLERLGFHQARPSPSRPAAAASSPSGSSSSPRRAATTTADDQVVKQLCQEFPSAKADVVRDVCISMQNNKSRAHHSLKSLGYQPKSAEPAASSSHRPSSGRSHGAASSPARKETSPKPVSEAMKNKAKARMLAEFKDQSAMFIEMALESCNYDESKTRGVLTAMAEKKPTSAGRARSTSPTKATTSASSSDYPASVSQVAVTFPEPPPSTSQAGASSTARDRIGSPSRSSAASSTSRHQPSPVSTPSTRTRAYGSDVKNMYSKKSAVTQQPRINSEFHTATKGADAGLITGPNRDLLIEEYMTQKGRNPELASGPDRELRQGPSGVRAGPDPSLRSGPQRSCRDGPNPELPAGPMHKIANMCQSCLVSAV